MIGDLKHVRGPYYTQIIKFENLPVHSRWFKNDPVRMFKNRGYVKIWRIENGTKEVVDRALTVENARKRIRKWENGQAKAPASNAA